MDRIDYLHDMCSHNVKYITKLTMLSVTSADILLSFGTVLYRRDFENGEIEVLFSFQITKFK